jgi:hypothetical protein
MIRLVRVELLKLRTMRVTYGLLAAAAAVTALFSALEASGAGRSVPPVSTAAGLGAGAFGPGYSVSSQQRLDQLARAFRPFLSLYIAGG